jgi:hypothetical protein
MSRFFHWIVRSGLVLGAAGSVTSQARAAQAEVPEGWLARPTSTQ